MNRALEGAELLGYRDNGLVAVWYGSYDFNVYDAARNWKNIDTFSSPGVQVAPDDRKEELAKTRMEMEDFTVIA